MRAFILVVAGVFASTFGPAMGQAVTAVTARVLPGGGVADPTGRTGFFPNTSGGIDALDLASGKVLWTTKDANCPLLATDQRLFAQAGKAHQIRVVVLASTQEGKRIRESQPITFPDWVSVDVAYGRAFRSGATMDAKGLWLSWEASAFYAGGARPTPQVEKAARKSASGVVRVDVETGTIEILESAQIAAGKFFPMPGGANPKTGALTLTIRDAPANNPQNGFEKRRTLEAVNEAKEVIWRHAIAAPVLLPPRP